MNNARRNVQRGMVLIAVLWALVVLSLIALALNSSVRVGAAELENHKEQLQAYYLARGGIFRTVALIESATDPTAKVQEFRPGQREVEWSENLGQVRVEIRDESGKVNLNRASRPVLERLFIALGLDLHSAVDLGLAIEQYRQPDSIVHSGSAESPRAAGLSPLDNSGNAAFRSVEDLMLVTGVTSKLFFGRYLVQDDGKVELRPGLVDCLTVNSETSQININYAPYPVLLAVPGIDPQVAGYIVSSRDKEPFTSLDRLSREFPVTLGGEALSMLGSESSGRYTFISTASTPNGITARIRAVVQVQGVSNAPYQILDWDDSFVH